MEEENDHLDFGEPISEYSRAQAIEDGVLVDVSSVAREAGIRFPTALTRAVWNQYVEVPPGVIGQDERGRLWDILWMYRVQVLRVKMEGATELEFEVRVRQDNRDRMPPQVVLKAILGPGDQCEPVITIMLVGED